MITHAVVQRGSDSESDHRRWRVPTTTTIPALSVGPRPAVQGRYGDHDVRPPGPGIGVGPGMRSGDRRQGPRVHVLVHTHDHA